MSDLSYAELPPFAHAWAFSNRARREGSVRLRLPDDAQHAGRKTFTVWMNLDAGQESDADDLLGWKDAKGKLGARVFWEDAGGEKRVSATLTTDARDAPLKLSFPLAVLTATSDLALVLRYARHRLELFVNGVLVDEEWPMGTLPAMESSVMLGSVDQAAVWGRALSNDEVIQISGGHDGLREGERRILGEELPVAQLWSPRGFDTHVGDCMPFFHAGGFHLFYLLDRRNHQSKWGLGAHQWAHASTTDLVEWVHHPLAIGLTEEDEGSICTGSVFFHAGIFRAFYSVRMADPSASPLCAATSPDGIHFTKHPPFGYLTAPYRGQPARDPLVFREDATGIFHMLVTSSLVNPAVSECAGCLAHLVSHDLDHWEQREPFLATGYTGDPECPDYFYWRGWFYLLFSHQGIAHYRMSRDALGPWEKPAMDTFDGPEVMVMKTAAFTGDRRIGVGFVPRARGVYGGRVIFREIIQRANGELGTQWPAELMPEVLGP